MPANLNTLGSRYFHSYAGDHQADWKEKTGKFCNFFGRVAFGKKIVINEKDYNVKVAHLAQKIFAGMAAVLLSGLCLIGTALLKASKSHRQAYERVINIEKIKKHTLLKSESNQAKNENGLSEEDELCKKAKAGLKPVDQNNTKMSPFQRQLQKKLEESEQFIRKLESSKLFTLVQENLEDKATPVANLEDKATPVANNVDDDEWELPPIQSDDELPSDIKNSLLSLESIETKKEKTSTCIHLQASMQPATATNKELLKEFEDKRNKEFEKLRRLYEGDVNSVEEDN